MNAAVEDAEGAVDSADELGFDIHRALRWFPTH